MSKKIPVTDAADPDTDPTPTEDVADVAPDAPAPDVAPEQLPAQPPLIEGPDGGPAFPMASLSVDTGQRCFNDTAGVHYEHVGNDTRGRWIYRAQ